MSIKVTPEFQARSLAFRAGVVVLVVLAGVLYLTFKAQTGMPFAQTTEVQVLVGDVHSLKVNDAVRENSKRIGRVSEIEYQDGNALVTMVLDGDVDVYKDARVSLWDLSALATKFIELDPGTPQAGTLGDQPIPARHADDSADLYELLDVLDPKTLEAATSTLRNFGGGMAGHGGDLSQFTENAPDVLGDLGSVSESLADPQADLPGLLTDLDTLSSHLRGRESEIRSLVAQTGDTLAALTVDSGEPLRETLRRLPGTLDHTERAMSALATPLVDTAQAMRALAPGAKALGRSEHNLRGFLRDAVPVAHQVPPFARQAVPAVEELTHTVADLRPLAPLVRQAIADALRPLAVIAPYAAELAQLFLRGASFVSQGPQPGVRYARLAVTPGVNTLTGGLFASGHASLPQNNYPRPGDAQYDRAGGLLPTGLPSGVN